MATISSLFKVSGHALAFSSLRGRCRIGSAFCFRFDPGSLVLLGHDYLIICRVSGRALALTDENRLEIYGRTVVTERRLSAVRPPVIEDPSKICPLGERLSRSTQPRQ